MTTALEMTPTAPPPLLEIERAIDCFALAEPPVELWQFARKETFRAEPGRERRLDRRYSLITNVIVVPLDEQLHTAGEPFVAISSGMSASGIRLIHTGPSPSGLLYLQINCQPVKFVLSVLRSRPFGECFEIAGRLTTAHVGTRLAAASGGNAGPTSGELLQWTALAAAAEMLKAEANRQRSAIHPSFRSRLAGS